MATLTFEQWAKKLEKWNKAQLDAVRIALKTGTEIVRAEAIRNHLSGPKMPRGVGSPNTATLARGTGDLAGSINTKVAVAGTKLQASVLTNLKYARIHSKGGTIVPVRARALKFKIGNQWIAAKRVTIPARPFLEPSLDAKRNEVDRIIANRIVEAYKQA